VLNEIYQIAVNIGKLELEMYVGEPGLAKTIKARFLGLIAREFTQNPKFDPKHFYDLANLASHCPYA
jgi:hypothetical protein